jgi:hypothetical protein
MSPLARLAASALLVAAAACGSTPVPATCSASSDCFTGYACDAALSQHCLLACAGDGDCLYSQHCDVAANPNQGVCRFGAPP